MIEDKDNLNQPTSEDETSSKEDNIVLSNNMRVSFNLSEADERELDAYSNQVINNLRRGHWYSINCVGGKERKIVDNLKRMLKHEDCMEVQQILVCYREKEVQRGKKKSKRILNDIPGAIFIKTEMTKDIHRIVRQLENVIGFIGEQKGTRLPPQVISGKEIDRLILKYLMETEVEESKKIEVNFKVGDFVEVINGALEGYIGEVLLIEKDTIKVAIDMLGRKVDSQVPILNVKPVN